jgi:hypothetical protein
MKMKFEFLKEKELELINNRFAEEDSIDYDNWDLMTDEEILITDAAMYVDGAYIDNEFEDLDEWCKEVDGSEYEEEYLINNPNVVREKIDLMLKKNIITIIK